jgi:amidase
MPAYRLSAAIHLKEVSCREVMTAYLDHIDRVNPKVNAIVARRERSALLAEAAEKDAQLASGQSSGWMHGMPQAPKDLAATKGIVTTFGSPIFRNHIPQADAFMVERMRRAGAIFIGKTNTPEFGLGSQTYNTVYGPTRNPYDPSKTCGGSSGGAATSLALRMLPVADGSDFAGSLRNPAAFCNVYGFRPSEGRVPYGPTGEVFVQQLGYEGAMGRTVKDIAMLLSVQSGYDARAPLSLKEDPQTFIAPLEADHKGRRIAWLGDWNGYLAMEPGILDLCGSGLATLRSIGCEVDETRVPFSPERLWRTFLVHRHFLAGGGLAAFEADPAKRALLKPEARWEVEGMRKLSAADIYSASADRSAWYQTVLAVFERYDAIAVPTAQVFPFDVDTHWPTHIAGRPMDTYHRWMEVALPWTLSGCPVVNVPVGFNQAGLPMGMQLIGRPTGDLDVLRLAHAYEAARDPAGTRLPRLIAAT